MIETMLCDGQYYFIEANPRLWGPLQLSIDSNPNLINSFIRDFMDIPLNTQATSHTEYMWANGMTTDENPSGQYRWYTEPPENLEKFIESKTQYDVIKRLT